VFWFNESLQKLGLKEIDNPIALFDALNRVGVVAIFKADYWTPGMTERRLKFCLEGW